MHDESECGPFGYHVQRLEAQTPPINSCTWTTIRLATNALYFFTEINIALASTVVIYDSRVDRCSPLEKHKWRKKIDVPNFANRSVLLRIQLGTRQ